MTTRLGRRVAIYVGTAAAVAVATLILLSLTVSSLEQATDRAREHQRVATFAQRVGALSVDAETAVRGYVLTGQDTFVAPLLNARVELPLVTARMEDAAQSADERRRARHIAALASTYLEGYAVPTLRQAQNDRADARARIAREEGKVQVDRIRSEIRALADLATRAASARQTDAWRNGRAAQFATVIGAVTLVTILILLMRALRREVVMPVLEATDAAGRIGAGDLDIRLPVRRQDEVGRLSAALNTMAGQLHTGAVELDAQHTELETQNAELETQSTELEAQAFELERRGTDLGRSNAELHVRTQELEAASESLRISSERVRLYAQVAESLTQVPDIERRATRLMDELADATRCAIGAIYVKTAQDDDALLLVGLRGLSTAPQTAEQAGDMAARALAERRTIVASHPETSLEFELLGARASVRHEIHLPLLAGTKRSNLLGVLALARTDDRPFDADEIAMLEHLTSTSAVALGNALVSAQRERQAALFRSVLASVSEAILVISPTEEVVIANPPMQAYARRLLDIGPDEPWDIESLRRAMTIEVRDPVAHQTRVAKLDADLRVIDRQTIELPRLGMWIDRYAAPVQGPDGEVLGRIVVMRDITEEHQAERAKDDLMSTVSHELRTPLAAILGFTELLATREFPVEERREYVDTVYEQSVRLSEILDDFLDLQRVERRGLEASHPVDLRALIEEQVHLYSAQSAAHEVSTTLSDDDLNVDGDGDRLRRVIGNLLSNAIKYSPAGGPVRVEAARENGAVRVAVVDRGIGIPDDARERVFDRFYRVGSRAAADIGGTGLGLALVRDIVVAHGGKVGLESVEGQGSRFWFTVPVGDS